MILNTIRILLKSTALTVLFCCSLNAAVTAEQVEEVYNRLIVKNGFTSHPPKAIIIIVSTNEVNAWSDGESIYITQPMMLTFKNVDELAMILGHELGHHYAPFWITSQTIRSELYADKMGFKYASCAGYNACNGAKWLRDINSPGGDGIHPPSIERYKILRAYCQ